MVGYLLLHILGNRIRFGHRECGIHTDGQVSMDLVPDPAGPYVVHTAYSRQQRTMCEPGCDGAPTDSHTSVRLCKGEWIYNKGLPRASYDQEAIDFRLARAKFCILMAAARLDPATKAL